MIVLRELAPAKINLYLHITGKRADGYHLLDSLVAFAEAGDKVEVVPADTVTLAVDGSFAVNIDAKDNSVVKAAEKLRDYFKVKQGAALTLHKNMPVASGIGGGSADAAATLRLLVRFWRLKPSPKELHGIALSLGADVPACLRSQSLYMSGIGESIEAGPPLSGIYVLLVNPGKPLATADVFGAHKGPFSSAPRHPHAFASLSALQEFLEKAKNDLQAGAMKKIPDIGKILALLAEEKDCRFSRMSGSGATCFGLFSSQQTADAAALRITQNHPKWWVKVGMMR